MIKHCAQCQKPLPPEAAVCAECGHEIALPIVDTALRPWGRKPFADAALTQVIDVPPGGFPPPPRPVEAPAAPAVVRTNRPALLLAVCIGLLAGLFVILLLVGITSLQRTSSASTLHRTGQ